jgi:hypothetical protein
MLENIIAKSDFFICGSSRAQFRPKRRKRKKEGVIKRVNCVGLP